MTPPAAGLRGTPPAAQALAAWAGEPLPARLRQRGRLAVCPFEALLREIPPGSTVLDLGCGSGLLLALLAADGRLRRGVGVDASPVAVDRARAAARWAADRGVALRFAVGDARFADPPEAPFDAVCVVDLLHHVPPGRRAAVLERAAALLRPGGLLVYKEMATRPRWRAAANVLHDLALSREHVRHVPSGWAERWAQARGMRCERRGVVHRLWYAHHLMVMRKPEESLEDA